MRRIATAALLVACALLAAACGREDPPDLANGKQLFIGEGQCGSCHALSRAGTTGTQGPDLDAAFGPARQAGMGEDTVEGIVRDQIAHPRKGSAMPANLVTGDDARDVAAYVALAAGMPGEDEGELASIGGAQGTDGQSIFSSLGCGSCHTFTPAGSSADVGPDLDELADLAGERKPGTDAEEYVRESLTDPNAFVVEGFQGVMPSFAEQLSEEQLDALVEYLLQTSSGDGS